MMEDVSSTALAVITTKTVLMGKMKKAVVRHACTFLSSNSYFATLFQVKFKIMKILTIQDMYSVTFLFLQ